MSKLKVAVTAFFLLLPFLNPVMNAQNTGTCKGKTTSLECLGAVSGMMVYNTYLAIGGIADGYSEKIYESNYVADLMEEQITALSLIDTSYMELLESGFITDADDKKTIEELQSAIYYLKLEAKYLKAYAQSNSQEDLDMYDEYRNKAWKKIASLLGIEE